MASKTIKGLTVEIGGDTTKLGKALKDVESKSRSLSKELGDINKLLKLDPGNTDLLAQKQEVLAAAVENTRKKLETLKEAEKQVQEQFARGDVSEEQLRALQREIVATENKMKGYQKAAQQTAEEVERLGKGSGEAGHGMNETGNEAQKSSRKVKDFADSAEQAEKASRGLGDTLLNVTKAGLATVGAAAGALVTGLVASAEATRDYRAEMGKLTTAYESSGHSADTARQAYQTLQGVIGETDQSVEAAQQIALLASSEEDVARWAELAAGVVGRFGDALQPETFFEAANETYKLGEATGAYTQLLEGAGYNVEQFNKGLAACTTEQEKQAYMLEITDQLLGSAAERYRETNAEIIRANQANEEWMASMSGVGGAIEPILTDVKLLGASLLSEAVPGVKALAEAFRGILNGEEGASADFGAQLSEMIAGIVTKVTELLPTVAEVGLSLITTLATTIYQQLPTVLSVGGQIAGQILAGIAQNLPAVLERGREILVNLSNGIAQNLPSLVNRGLDIIGGLADKIYAAAPQLIQTGFEILSNIVTGIVNSLPTLISKAPEIISKFANTINDNFPTILAKGVELVVQIVMGIIKAIPTLVENIPKIITAIVDVWEAFNWLSLGKKAITLLKDGVLSVLSAVKSAGKTIANGAAEAIRNLPTTLLNIGKSAVNDLGGAIRNGVSTVTSGASAVLNGVVNTFKSLPSRMLSIGSDLVRGLWNGISNMTGWVLGKIQSFAGSVLSGIKSFFGIRSPSRVFRDEVGAMLAEGMAEGITENANAPLEAMDKLSRDLLGDAESLGGITLERRVETTFGGQTYTKPDVLGTLGRLESLISSFFSSGGLSVTLNIEHFENKTESDLDEIADYVASKIQTKITKKGAAFA